MDVVTARVLVISGSMGAGKTTVLGEASDLLCARHVAHASFDLDALGLLLLPEPESNALHYRNLSAMFRNCRDAGISYFLIAAAIENRLVLGDLRRTFEDADLTVCRLTASTATMVTRLRVREVGMRRDEFVARSHELDAMLTAEALEDFCVANDARNVTDVATEMLLHANWIGMR